MRHDNDYADIDCKLWRLLTDFKGAISRNKVFGCVSIPNNTILKIWKGGGVTKAKIAIKYLCENEEVRAKLFLPVHMRLWQSLLSKIIGWKSRNTVPLRITPTWSFIRNSGFLINLQIGVNNSSMLQQHKLYNIHTVLYCTVLYCI